jgi:hypothetical protein
MQEPVTLCRITSQVVNPQKILTRPPQFYRLYWLHNLMVLSSLRVAIVRPSGLTARSVTAQR